MQSKKYLKYILSALYILSLSNVIAQNKYVVDSNGKADFSSIQQALDNIPCRQSSQIFIKNGIYKEKIVVPTYLGAVELVGESTEGVIIDWDDYSGRIVGTDTVTTHSSYTFRVKADDFTARNITFINSAGRVGQAVAVEVKSDKVRFLNCRFIGNQDTYYAYGEGRVYFYNCYIEGTTDYIFGKSITYFDSCTIHSKSNSFITAASTLEGCHYGYIFNNCKLTADSSVKKMYLGRPWRSYARTVFMNCDMGSFIAPEGWNNWGSKEKEKTVFYAEYKNYGLGSDTTKRVAWSHQLSDAEILKYQIPIVFSKKASRVNFPENWDPKK